MLLFVRSALPRAGRFQEAYPWAREIGECVVRSSELERVDVFSEVLGAVGRIYWVGEIADLAMLERVMAQLQSNEEYMGLVSRGGELIADGTLHDLVLRPL